MKNEILVDDDRTRASARTGKDTAEMHAPAKIAGVLVGRLVELEKSRGTLVDFPGNPSTRPVAALSILPLGRDTVGRQVVLMFEEGDPKRPVVMGLVEDRDAGVRQPVELMLDKTRLVFTAEEELVLRCGKASITLTRAGKVLIRGAYILNRSSGVNRIKGGSVQIN